ncbi:very-long-chain 3-oxoacyl-CoA reductase-like isoform X2 [Callorhinchus milii]|uniref:very-long-chain 3-oxoacyl-CoA reductase-like isoform X2 n=1 Tax=Callorhinchus milii TaxID=7868 RepID=UPI001C3FDAB7|nr:very-long-chain 3-oxoacyl-CoA reductase-like isoform X2 [Callorhinchus milii]
MVMEGGTPRPPAVLASWQTWGLALIGAVTCAGALVRFTRFSLTTLRTHVLSEYWKVDLKSYGKWAVVTGATSGIGKGYARELARQGLNVVLISRSWERLKDTAAEIEKEHGRSVKIIQADFTKGPSIYGPIAQSLGGLEIGILVNNVGKTYQPADIPSYFLDVTEPQQAIADIVNCNVLSGPMMTGIILPQMVERKKGIIINVSSEAGTHPHPMFTMYSATKVFIDFFSRALNTEYKTKGIIVQCVMPLFVATKMNYKDLGVFVKSPDQYAREALNTVGLQARTNGCLVHTLQGSQEPRQRDWRKRVVD